MMDSHADFIITNARVITLDPQKPRAEAVSVTGNRISFVGSALEANAWRGPYTRVIDAQGFTLMPGFIDSHFHLRIGSAELGNIPLEGVKSLEDLRNALQKFCQEHEGELWITGSHLNYNILPENERLSRHHLDAIISERPVALMAFDYHTMWVNTLALEMAGILHGGDTGPNSEIVIGQDGFASGELREPAAYGRILALTGVWGRAMSSLTGVPIDEKLPYDETQERTMLRKGLELANRVGITSIHNMDGNLEQIRMYRSLEEAGELTLRVYVPLSITPKTPPEALSEAVFLRDEFNSGMIHSGFVKFFMDGVMESWTALLMDDYADKSGWHGSANYSLEHFTQMAIESDRLGLQISVHAIGDGAVKRVLDGFEAVRRMNGIRDSRHRIEHIELVHPSDLPRFANLGVIASMQPLHAVENDEGNIWLIRVGKQRWQWGFAWQIIRQSGAKLIFGSDWPVVSKNPILGLHKVLNRRAWSTGMPDQRQTLMDAIASYTKDAAYAEFQEHQKGQIQSGMLADLVLLSGNLEETPPEGVSEITVLMTICDGRIVFES